MDHDHLEERHFELLLSQTRCMLHCSREGATFVCKFFEGSSRCTLSFLAFLTRRFRTTSVIKPTSSRPTNSERYVVCRDLLPPLPPLPPHPTEDEDPLLAALADGTLVLCEAWMAETRAVLDRMAADQAEALSRVLARAGVDVLAPVE